MSFLEIKGLSKTYPNADGPCIKDIDFSMNEGEIVVLLGPSGCGKTTFLKIISGLERQDCGTAVLDGTDLKNTPPERRPVSMVFQKAYLFRNMSVAKNVNYAPRLNCTMNKKELNEETERMLKLVELESFGDRKATELSGGQEQRVSLARALITKPKLLLLDEPFSALDAKLRISMRESLRKICKSIGQTVIFVTHDQQEAVAIADRIALIMDGRIIQYDKPEAFYHKPVSKKTALFFGWKNAIPAEKEEGRYTTKLGTFDIEADTEGDDILLMIHPQAFIAKDDGEYEATVKEASYMGTMSNYKVDCNGLELDIQISSRNMYIPGETIKFDIDREMMYPVADEQDVIVERIAPKKRTLAERISALIKKDGESK